MSSPTVNMQATTFFVALAAMASSVIAAPSVLEARADLCATGVLGGSCGWYTCDQ